MEVVDGRVMRGARNREAIADALLACFEDGILRPSAGQIAGFVAIGVAITLVLEWLATGPLGRWAYAEAMPVLPLLGVGLTPVLQWVLLPPLVAWFVRRQLT